MSDDQELVLRLPESAYIPEGATFYEGEDDGRCRLIRADGRRCGAARTRAYGLCGAHAGTSMVTRDPAGAARLAAQARTERKQRRLLLGVTSRQAADPRMLVRERLQERREEAARAVVDGVLDDGKLSGLQRQTGMLAAIEAAYPSVTAQLAVDLPANAEEAAALEWEQLKALAASHLGGSNGEAVLLDPA